jgi:hypothetical protein
MAKKKKLNIWKTVKLVLTNEKVGELLWCIAMSLIDDGKISHEERTQIRAKAMQLLEDILTGD